MSFAKRGYPDFDPRIPPGWRVVLSDPWPINTTIGPDDESPDFNTWRFETYGDVANPLSLTYDDFLRLPHVRILADHQSFGARVGRRAASRDHETDYAHK